MASVTVDTFIRSLDEKLEYPVRQHLKNVYTCLTISTIVAAVGAYVHMFTNLIAGGLLSTLGLFGFLIALFVMQDNGKNRLLRLAFLLGLAFCTGLSLGPLLTLAMDVNPSIIVTALIGTSLVFLSFTLSAMFAERGAWLYLGGILGAMLDTLLIFSLANIFLGSYLLFEIELYLGLLMECLFVLYDTQLIMERKRNGDGDFILHSLFVFVDFVGIFGRVVIILLKKENQRKNRED